MIYLFYLIVYGFLFTATAGLIASWIDRKVTARVQYRVGPPFFQPFIDIVKLMGKETLVPEAASRFTFLAAPLMGMTGVMVASAILCVNDVHTGSGFVGDVIVAVYLFTVPSLSIIMGGFASRNPLATLGASREMKLILSYELPFILAILVAVIKSGFSVTLGGILDFQAQNGFIAGSLSGFLAFLAGILCVQAKLGLVPFDIAEAETEITSGPLIEYSGVTLGMYKLMKNMLLFVLPFFLIILFLGGLRFDGIQILYSALKYAGILVVITVIRNTNPRLRIDQAVRFFWGPVTIISIIAVVLAFLGL